MCTFLVILIKKKVTFPPHVGLGGSGGFTVPSRYFLLCIHFVIISSHLFNVDLGPAINMINFSIKHKSHCFPPLGIGCAFAFIDHVISCSCPSLVHFARYVDNEVECSCSGSWKLDLWPFHLSLNVSSVNP